MLLFSHDSLREKEWWIRNDVRDPRHVILRNRFILLSTCKPVRPAYRNDHLVLARWLLEKVERKQKKSVWVDRSLTSLLQLVYLYLFQSAFCVSTSKRLKRRQSVLAIWKQGACVLCGAIPYFEPPPWSRCNIVTSDAAVRDRWVNLLVEVFSGIFPQH